jgi:hypothetical protein
MSGEGGSIYYLIFIIYDLVLRLAGHSIYYLLFNIYDLGVRETSCGVRVENQILKRIDGL